MSDNESFGTYVKWSLTDKVPQSAKTTHSKAKIEKQNPVPIYDRDVDQAGGYRPGIVVRNRFGDHFVAKGVNYGGMCQWDVITRREAYERVREASRDTEGDWDE